MGAAFCSGGFEECVPTVTASLSVVITATRLQAAGPFPGALFRTTFTLLYPPLPCNLLHTVPFLRVKTKGDINREKKYSLINHFLCRFSKKLNH